MESRTRTTIIRARYKARQKLQNRKAHPTGRRSKQKENRENEDKNDVLSDENTAKKKKS